MNSFSNNSLTRFRSNSNRITPKIQIFNQHSTTSIQVVKSRNKNNLTLNGKARLFLNRLSMPWLTFKKLLVWVSLLTSQPCIRIIPATQLVSQMASLIPLTCLLQRWLRLAPRIRHQVQESTTKGRSTVNRKDWRKTLSSRGLGKEVYIRASLTYRWLKRSRQGTISIQMGHRGCQERRQTRSTGVGAQSTQLFRTLKKSLVRASLLGVSRQNPTLWYPLFLSRCKCRLRSMSWKIKDSTLSKIDLRTSTENLSL